MESRRFRFGLFEFDAVTRELRREGFPVRLQSQPALVLAYLVARPGESVSREELRKLVWGEETFVDFDRGLNFCISQIRLALKDDASEPRYVQTIPKTGYRFVAPVFVAPAEEVSEGKPVPVEGSTSGRRGHFWLAGAAGVVIAMVTGAAYFWHTRSAATPPIVAVLRFDNETGNPEMSRFSDALTDSAVEQLTAGSKGRYLVVGNAQILRVPREERDLNAVAASLHASYVVLGQIQSEGSHLRILAHLIRLPGQTHIWVVRMDREVSDPLALESEVARKIAGDFSPRLDADAHGRSLPEAASH